MDVNAPWNTGEEEDTEMDDHDEITCECSACHDLRVQNGSDEDEYDDEWDDDDWLPDAPYPDDDEDDL